MNEIAVKQQQPHPKETLHSTKPETSIIVGSLEQHPILRLQRIVGNQAVQRLLQTTAQNSKTIPIGVTTFNTFPVSAPPIQRACACGGRCAKCQSAKSEEETETLQTKRADESAFTAPPIQRQQGQPTEQDYRDYIRETVRFLNQSADFYRDAQRAIDQALFDRLLNSWYRMVVTQEKMIDDHLNGDATLKRNLHTAYIAAIRVLMPRAARALGQSEGDLYRENNGRIPLWAWQTAHHLEQGISTPIAAGRAADPVTGEVVFDANGFHITIAPDGSARRLGNGAETTFNITWGNISARTRVEGRTRRVASFTGPQMPPSVQIQTLYGPGASATTQSGYGRGTTAQDVAGGQVTPRSTSLGHHEGNHGLDFVEFLQSNPPPQFTGAVGMSVADFQRAMNQWSTACRNYNRDLDNFSKSRTDCVGTTIDQFHQANARRGARVRLVCNP